MLLALTVPLDAASNNRVYSEGCEPEGIAS